MWKDIVGYEGIYQISNCNEGVRKIMKDGYRIMKVYVHRGYSSLTLSKGKISKGKNIHRLVAINFLPNPDNLPLVCHKYETLIDGKLDNSVDNLFWGTYRDNNQDKHRKGRANNNLQLRNPKYNLGKTGSNSHLAKKVLQYDLKGNFIREWGSMIDIENKYGFSKTNVSGCCRGKLKTACGFIFKYK